jgi:ribosomal protein S18 acetylase RimI-like enzyme
MALNIEKADAYKILADNETVGSVFIYQTGENRYELDTISVLPEYLNKGIGDCAISLVESNYPDAVCWTLQTPEKDIRNRHLYEKHGYLAVDSVEVNEYLSLIQYRKQLKETL